MLDFVGFNALTNWSVQYLGDSSIRFNRKYPLMRVGDFLTRNKTVVTIKDDIKYKRVTIRVRNGGVMLRDEVQGNNIGTKRQFLVSGGQFILSKIDARNGAMGIVPDALNGAVVTQDFLPYDIDETLINPRYLVLLCTTRRFTAFCHSCSSGTTNRRRVNEKQFLNIKVPLPSLEDQSELIKEYDRQIAEADCLSEKAEHEENNLHNYILERLGIGFPGDADPFKKENGGILSFVRYKDIDRWDVGRGEHYINSLLDKSIYPVSILGLLDFTTRKWMKDTENFRYIEMSDVDPVFGIVDDSRVATDKAPSRATQIVETGDLIIGTTRPYLKRFAIVPEKYDRCVCSSAFQIIRPDKKYNIEFVYYFLQTRLAIIQLESRMTGALYPAINTSDLRRIKIPLPPLTVQNSIARHANEKREIIKTCILESRQRRIDALTRFESRIFE